MARALLPDLTADQRIAAVSRETFRPGVELTGAELTGAEVYERFSAWWQGQSAAS